MCLLCIGTEVYMGEAGQDMYIDTIGMCVWYPCSDVMKCCCFRWHICCYWCPVCRWVAPCKICPNVHFNCSIKYCHTVCLCVCVRAHVCIIVFVITYYSQPVCDSIRCDITDQTEHWARWHIWWNSPEGVQHGRTQGSHFRYQWPH